jgi:hypothetical protein
MIGVIAVVVGLVALTMVGSQVLRAWSRGRHTATNRYVLVSSTVDAVVMLALVRAVQPPPVPLSWVWMAAAGAVGLGVAGAVLRWPELGWSAPGGNARRGALRAAAYAILGAGMLAVLA